METTTIEGRVCAHCRSCEALIVWTLTEKGKRMPVDAEPVAGGNLRLDHERPVHSFVVEPSLLDELDTTDDGKRYVSHFSTCPDAATWRNGEPAPNTPGPEKYRTMHRSF
jgi:hypothetical protein